MESRYDVVRYLLGSLLIFASLLGAPVPSSRADDQPPGTPKDEAALLEADRAFDADTATRRLDGWLAAFAESGAMLLSSGATVVGHEAIAEVMRPAFDDPDFTLRWQPQEARILIPGQLGYTKGRFQQHVRDEQGNESVTNGTYVTVWKKQPDGSWKIAFDTGNEDTAGLQK
jgi:ketosteroid isomerase-like protein